MFSALRTIFSCETIIHMLDPREEDVKQDPSFEMKNIYIYFFLHLTVAGVFLTAIINAQWFSTSLYHRGL